MLVGQSVTSKEECKIIALNDKNNMNCSFYDNANKACYGQLKNNYGDCPLGYNTNN